MALKRVAGGETKRLRQTSQLQRVARQGLRLQVVAILQNVFCATQKSVVCGQQLRLIQRNFPCNGKGCERGYGGLDSKAGVPTATNQLPQLRAEFQLANAAATELDVALIVLLGTQLCVQFAHARDRVKIKITTEHKRCGQRSQRPARRARSDARLEPRNALPHAALRDKILLQKIKRRHHRTGVTIRPQTGVDTEHKLAINVLIQGSRDASRQQVERIHRVHVWLVTDVDHVNVRRRVELLRAELAHGDGREAKRRIAGAKNIIAVRGGRSRNRQISEIGQVFN